ncbi:hypothetical protein MSG28_002947 [Choristoneura fumiferana]|uniref:Uncharacterized protein n=1 Tax=Choristoneura fumiferana TaxID=7141 RepID=A0ACC0JK07_CHOFU|nr:hypothetical protein MSG28_002947 [Choristoneura fumiferana]
MAPPQLDSYRTRQSAATWRCTVLRYDTAPFQVTTPRRGDVAKHAPLLIEPRLSLLSPPSRCCHI